MSSATESALSLMGSISIDTLAVLLCCALFVTYGTMKGKDKLLVFLFSLYPAVLVTSFFPFYALVGDGVLSRYVPLIVFALSVAGIFYVLKDFVDANYQPNTLWRWIEVITLSVMSVGLCLALMCHSADLHLLYSFSPMFYTAFTSPYALFAWLVAPLASVPLLVKG